MTVYYVSPSGSDSNNGLGPDASHATNKPWLTIGKALGASGIASGDTVYIGPGTYREVVTVAMTSATVTTSVIGDPANAQGFKDGSGNMLVPASVRHSAYTTNDTTAPSATPTLNLNGRDFLLFQNLEFIGGTGTTSCIASTTTNAVTITFRECLFVPGGARTSVSYTGLADVAANWVFDRCRFLGTGNVSVVAIILPTSTVADYDSNFVFQNSIFIGGVGAINASGSGANSFKGGGIDILNCIFLGVGALQASGANISTSISCTVYNSIIFSPISLVALNANTSGQIVEDYNVIYATTPRTNVSSGANSISDYSRAPLLHVGQELVVGQIPRPVGMPVSGSPLLGFGNQSSPGGNTLPVVDILNRPRPAGGASTSNAVGAFERHDTAVQETSVVQAGSSAIKLIGPGDHDFQIPVDAVSTTISIYSRYDTNHGTTNKPQVQLLANGAIGVSTETKTMTVGVDTWEQLTFTAQTPTAKGVVTLRLVSRAAAGNGIAYFDTAAVA